MENIQQHTDPISKKIATSKYAFICLFIAALILIVVFIAVAAGKSGNSQETSTDSLLKNSAVTSINISASGKVIAIKGTTITISSGKDSLSFTTDKNTLFLGNVPILVPKALSAPPPLPQKIRLSDIHVNTLIQATLTISKDNTLLARSIVTTLSAAVTHTSAASIVTSGGPPLPPPLPVNKKASSAKSKP